MHDYVIVGAGSAGCVLANRLSEDPKTTVLVLEAGGSDRAREIRIPVAFSKLFKSAFDWAYETEEQAHLHNRKLYWPRGKVLGGSSSINAMVYIRGSRQDYDSWAQLGNPGWSFSEVLPYFKKSEDQERDATAYHGVGGPLRVEDLREANPLSRAFIEACVEIGLPRNADFNGREQEGVGFYQVTQKRGRRHSAADAYLRRALRRPNLLVRLHAHATRLLFEGRRVTGVEYLRDGKASQAAAQKGVILCGGTVNSPQLLMLSGLGPAAQLQALGIPVVMDLPGVGLNLQDHLIVALACSCTQAVGLENAECFSNSMRYVFLRKGPLTSNVAEAGGFIRTRRELQAADLQIVFGPLYYLNHGLTRPDGHGLSIGSTLIRPESRGSIRLRSANPLEPPAIEPNYLSSEADLRVLVEGLKLARRISRAKAFRAFCGQETYPGAQVKSDEAIAEYIRQSCETLYHPVGTCKMGKDAMSVVNTRLQVHGLDGLRVVDASIMPSIVGGNTNAPTIMIAEKAADLIKQST